MLRPNNEVQKVLLSSPARFTGEYIGEDWLVTHAWQLGRNQRPVPSFDRSYLIVAFETGKEEKTEGSPVINWTPTGEYVASMMSLLYGKRFDSHGSVEMTGSFHVPNLETASDNCNPLRPYHGDSLRADYAVPLKLSELFRFRKIMEEKATDRRLGEAFHTATLFYSRALRAIHHSPEIAYLHLITACERMAEVAPFDERIELEAVIATALASIEAHHPDGQRIANLFRKRMRQLKRRFSALLTTHLDEAFFTRTESKSQWGHFTATSFPKAAAAAYDLRSRYVHTGASFGDWIEPQFENEERQTGKPIVEDKAMAKVLEHAPTFIGLERVTRFVMLKFAEQLGADLPDPNPVPEASGEGA